MGSVGNQYIYTNIYEIIMHEWKVSIQFAYIYMNTLRYIVWLPAPDSTVGTALN